MVWFTIIVLLLALDRITKYLVVRNIESGSVIVVIDRFFSLTNYDNYGAAWGIFQNGRFFFIALTTIVTIILIFLIAKQKSCFLKTSLSIILSGALGNLIDRVVKGGVTDFLYFTIGDYYFPIFNIADICIVVGTILLLIHVIFIYREPANSRVKAVSQNKSEGSEDRN